MTEEVAREILNHFGQLAIGFLCLIPLVFIAGWWIGEWWNEEKEKSIRTALEYIAVLFIVSTMGYAFWNSVGHAIALIIKLNKVL